MPYEGKSRVEITGAVSTVEHENEMYAAATVEVTFEAWITIRELQEQKQSGKWFAEIICSRMMDQILEEWERKVTSIVSDTDGLLMRRATETRPDGKFVVHSKKCAILRNRECDCGV